MKEIVWKYLTDGNGKYSGVGSAKYSYHHPDICAATKTPEYYTAQEWEAIGCMLAGSPTMYRALKKIIEVCGVVDFSSHNQMREAIEGVLAEAEGAIDLMRKNNDSSEKKLADLEPYFGDKAKESGA